MKIILAKKIMHFILNVLKAIIVVFLCILAGDLISLVWNGGHTYEVYKSRTFISDLHDEAFFIFITFLVVSLILAYSIEWYLKLKSK
jgi:hypothetical protein